MSYNEWLAMVARARAVYECAKELCWAILAECGDTELYRVAKAYWLECYAVYSAALQVDRVAILQPDCY